ncbi:MAG TPA: COX15/CtaA family protein [Acidobacteriota bacterium]|nr:COX15/CtaA family protein [Acidobacteriota bacterium]
MKLDRFAKYCWAVLAYTVIVILWGAFVRATGSGAGCGSHWPTCNGEVIPRSASTETLIEFTHRFTSGLLGILALGLLIWAFRRFPAGHLARKGAAWSMAFILSEALIGAGIVKFEWVADNDSMARVITVAFHLVNTFLLLGVLTLTAWWASGGTGLRWRGNRRVAGILAVTVALVLIVGASGAVTALGDTLVLTSGLRPQESPVLQSLVTLRFIHPMLALAMLPLILACGRICSADSPHPQTRTWTRLLMVTFHFQLLLGITNVFLKAPVWIQMLHLLLADALWVFLVLTAATSLSAQTSPARDVEGRAYATGS